MLFQHGSLELRILGTAAIAAWALTGAALAQTAQSNAYVAISAGSIEDFGVPNLSGGQVVRLDVPPADGTTVRIEIPLDGLKIETLLLDPVTVRDEGYQLLVQAADGQFVPQTPGIEKTYGGFVIGIPDSSVAASFLADGVYAAIFLADGTTHWIQPLSESIPGSDPALHIVYRGDDTLCEGWCGTPDEEIGTIPTGDVNQRGNCGAGVGPCLAQLACDADWQYYDDLGSVSAVEDRITATINVINHQYVREVYIQHRITTILVRTAEPDPYGSFDASTLLDQFQAEWQNNQGGITRDLAHLFTGRELTGSTIGIAWVEDICTSQAYGLSQPNFSTNFSCQTDLTAHEMGHNWGASHCSCPTSTMNPVITCANTFSGAGSSSAAAIAAYRDTRTCVGTVGTPPPANNTCDNATIIRFNGTHTGSTLGATSDGGHTICGSDGGGLYDIFWQFTAPVAGTVTLDTCGSDFDTVLSVHDGCPAGIDNLVACNDDGAGCAAGTLQSSLSFSALGSRTYFIRVAGYNGATGSVTLHINAPGSATNSVCGGAVEISDGTLLVGTLFGAGADGDASCGTSDGNQDVWYVFNAACNGTLLITTCGTDDMGETDLGMDTVVSIHSACPGTEANQLACNDDAGVPCPPNEGIELDSRVSAVLSAGDVAYVRVTHYSERFRNGIFRLQADYTSTLTAPLINAIANQTISAGVAYTGPTPTLTQACMSPVAWSLITGPAGMTIAANGVVHWPNPTTVGSPHTVRIRASNAQGSDDEIWSLTVTVGCPNPGSTGNFCSADTDGNCQINLQDLAIVLSAFGSSSGGPTYDPDADTDSDGDVDLQDIANLLSQFGDACN